MSTSAAAEQLGDGAGAAQGGEPGPERPGVAQGGEPGPERPAVAQSGEPGPERPGVAQSGEPGPERPGVAQSGEPGPERPGQAARRQRVVEAAVELASEGGYDAVQMRDVAARAGVALGTIYRYFLSKDQLLAAAEVAWARQLQERLGRRPPAGDDPLTRLLDVIGRACRAIERNQLLSSALVTAIASPDPGVHHYQAEINLVVTDMFSQALDGLDEARQAGVVRVLSNVWFAALIGWVHGWRQVRTIGEEMAFAAEVLLATPA